MLRSTPPIIPPVLFEFQDASTTASSDATLYRWLTVYQTLLQEPGSVRSSDSDIVCIEGTILDSSFWLAS